MLKMKKHLAVAVTVALLAFPLTSAIAQACIPDTPVGVATTALHAEAADPEAAVAAYEAGPITTLAQVATAEGLKAAADTAVAAVGSCGNKNSFRT